MRKYILIITLIFVQTKIVAQTQMEFEKFINLFDIYDNYPFVLTEDYFSSSGSGIIDEKLLEIFVYNQGIRTVALGCELDYFIGYNSYVQFPSTDSVFLLAFMTNMKDAACRYAILLGTYSKYNYKLQDTLWIFVEGGLEPQYIDENKVVCNLLIESTLTEDSICVTRTESHFLRLTNIPRGQPRSKKIKETIYNTTYKMTVGGKFIMIRDEKKEEILDPVANRLKETPRIVR